MRRFLNFGLLSVLAILSAPAHADQQGIDDVKMIGMLRSDAVNAQFQGDTGRALEKYEQALTTAKGAFGDNAPYLSEIYYDMGSLCLSNSKFEKAEGYLNQALKLNPNSSAAHLRLAELKLLQSRFVSQQLQYAHADEAAKHASAVLAKHKDDVVAHKELAQAFETADDSRRAYREYTSCDQLIQFNRDVYDGKPVSVKFSPVFTPLNKPKVEKSDDAAAKAQQDAKKKADEAKAAAEAKKRADADKKAEEDAKKNSVAAAKKKADQDKKKLEQAVKKALEKQKADEDKKKKKTPAKPATPPSDTIGIPATLSSKAVLLTPVKKKPPAVESTEKKPALIKQIPQADSSAEVEEQPEKTPPPPKKPVAKPVEPPAPKPGKHAPGLVPPPPPVMPTFQMMPPPQAVAPPPKPKAQPKIEKPKEQAPVAKEDKPDKVDKSGGADEDDFLLDWGGANAKKKPKGK